MFLPCCGIEDFDPANPDYEETIRPGTRQGMENSGAGDAAIGTGQPVRFYERGIGVMNDTGGFDSFALDGLFSIFVTLGCIALAWVLLQEVKFDRILRRPQSPRARLLQLMIAVGLGHLIAGFVLNYWHWAGSVKWFFSS
jgi:uncharacterized membrane protein YwzB